MSNVLNKNTLQYLKSVDTVKYLNGDWIINPVLPTCEKKYWKIVGGEVQEMTPAEKEQYDIDHPILVLKRKETIMSEILEQIIVVNGQINIENKIRIQSVLKEKPFFQLYLDGTPQYDLARQDVIDAYNENFITAEDLYKILNIVPLVGDLEPGMAEIFAQFESGGE